jgi:hypothetical protein
VKNMGILKYCPTSLMSYERGWPLACLEDLIKPNQAGLPSGCQVNIKCFYAKSTCLGSNYRNISSLTLVQKVIPRYLQRTVDNHSRAYLWLISHDLSHGVPLVVWIWKCCFFFFFCFFFNEVRDAASNSAYYGYPKLWILRYPAHRYHAVHVLTIRPRRST